LLSLHWRGIFPERPHLVLAEAAGPALAELSEAQGAQPDPLERLDLVADRLGHSPHLALATLADRDLHLALSGSLHLGRCGRAVLQADTAAQLLQLPLGGRAGQADPVGLGHPVARMGQMVGELAVVGQQDQARGVSVEPADRIQAQVRIHQLGDRPAAARLAGGRDHPRRLVDQPDLARLRRHGPAVDLHPAALVHIAGRVGHQLAANHHPPGPNHLLGGAAGGDAGVGQVAR
jgi:hypothetical protein